MKNRVTIFCCPECGSPNVTETEEQKWMVNTGEHYCHSVKPHDADAKCDCLDCGWTGLHMNLIAHNGSMKKVK